MAEGRIRNSKFLALLVKYFARAHIWVYQRTNGRLGAKLLWLPAALVTTKGRRTGEPRQRCICATVTASCCLRRSAGVIATLSGITT
jgi:hypothetical protein